MASSRRSARSAEARGAPSDDDAPILSALRDALARHDVAASGACVPPALIVAFSGGLDSTVLLHALARTLDPARLLAVHVDHGLQPAARGWPSHCEAVAHALGTGFECVRVEGSPPRGASLEAWARDARYAALARVAARARVPLAFTAHHADDQVETVLMRAARGTGPGGLAGMDPVVTHAGVRIGRPLLGISRAMLRDYAQRHALRWVDDPTNEDTRRLRNAVRLRLVPALERAIPGFRSALLGALPALRAQRDVADALARDDLERCRADAGALDRRALASLPPDRLAAALRRWIADRGMRAPTRARLAQMGAQLVDGRGAYGCVRHEGADFVRYRDRVEVLVPRAPDRDDGAESGAALLARLRWAGEPRLELPGGAGRLVFTRDAAHPGQAPGVSTEWLRGCTLEVRPGASSPRLRLRADGCSQSMKNLYQARGVPAWMRPRLPLVYADSRLLYAAGFGMDRGPHWPRSGETVSIGWEAVLDDDPRRAFCAPHHL